MYYGQLIGGRDALQAYKQGLQCMLKNQSVLKENMKQAQQRAATNAFTMGEFDSVETLQLKLKASDKQISSAYTSMSELYVTDLCDEPEAESECEKLLTLALQASSDNPDALYACANLRTIQQRLPEARQVMQKLFEAIEACRASSIETIPFLKLADDQRDKNLPEIIANNDVSYELRVASAKLALELEAYEPALELLEQLLDEDDRIIEVLHLASVCAYHSHAFSSSLEYCEKAERLLATEEDAGMGDEEDAEENDEQRVRMEQEEIDATKRALAELKRQIKEAIKHAPPEPEVEEGEEDDDEDHKQNGNAMADAQGSAMED